MNSHAEARTRTRRSRTLLTLYILAIAAICALFTVGISRSLFQTRDELGDWHAGMICYDIPRGDRVLLVDTDTATTNLIQVLGIASPPPDRGADLDTMAATLHLREAFLLKQGISARGALYAWVNRRHVQVEIPDGWQQTRPDGPTEAYASCQGVDIGRKLLRSGQAIALDINHPRLAEYRRYEAEAREKKIGLWREE